MVSAEISEPTIRKEEPLASPHDQPSRPNGRGPLVRRSERYRQAYAHPPASVFRDCLAVFLLIALDTGKGEIG